MNNSFISLGISGSSKSDIGSVTSPCWQQFEYTSRSIFWFCAVLSNAHLRGPQWRHLRLREPTLKGIWLTNRVMIELSDLWASSVMAKPFDGGIVKIFVDFVIDKSDRWVEEQSDIFYHNANGLYIGKIFHNTSIVSAAGTVELLQPSMQGWNCNVTIKTLRYVRRVDMLHYR